MKLKISIPVLALSILFFNLPVKAQVEKVIVETYYISDTTDGSDTTGGHLAAGSKTYRVYIDLPKGYTLKKIYGDALHPLKFSSTAVFFNNLADGQTFGKDFSKNRLQENTVALDSWLTLGQTTRTATKTYFGVIKPLDDDGSFIGGTNNDGGSAGIANGLLTNADPLAGIPLTNADGMDTLVALPGAWGNYGIVDTASGVDSTIFGSAKTCSSFISYNAGLQNSGVQGVNPDSNQILVAQLTTTGDLSFELNIVVTDSNQNEFRYVAAGHDTTYTSQGHNIVEELSPSLKYPPECGCTDPNYLEYSPSFACNNQSACRTPIVFGCMDSMACNFDPFANFNIETLCCYPGHCNDRDISIVCPNLNSGRQLDTQLDLFPNPSAHEITIHTLVGETSNVSCVVLDALGRVVFKKDLGTLSGYLIEHFNISNLESGLYIFRLNIGETTFSKTFIKN